MAALADEAAWLVPSALVPVSSTDLFAGGAGGWRVGGCGRAGDVGPGDAAVRGDLPLVGVGDGRDAGPGAFVQGDWPSLAVPVKVGATVLRGGLARMTALADEAD